MSLHISISKQHNNLRKEDVLVPRLEDQIAMDFQKFCEYMAENTIVSAADISMVMTLIDARLPELLNLNVKAKCTPSGLTFSPRISGSLSQSQLRAKLQARQSDDTERPLQPADLMVNDLTATIGVEIPKIWQRRFQAKLNFMRVVRRN